MTEINNKTEETLDLSIIIPFAGEYPQVLFTIQSVAQSLLNTGISFEIIAIDNYCLELVEQWRVSNKKAAGIIQNKIHASSRGTNQNKVLVEDIEDGFAVIPKCYQTNKAGEAVEAASKGNSWLKYMRYTDRLSHWECKRLACEIAKADTFLFLDAHVIPSIGIDTMLNAYQYFRKKGTFHMPLTYKILEWHKLVYKLVIANNFWGYSFTPFEPPQDTQPLEVPCMSTCGMMISKEIYQTVGGWPESMKAYGGGENFINFALAACGFKKWVFPPVTLFHHGEKRDYHYTYDGIIWNRMISHYLFGGVEFLDKMMLSKKGDYKLITLFKKAILSNAALRSQRRLIKGNTTVDLNQWRNQWEH